MTTAKPQDDALTHAERVFAERVKERRLEAGWTQGEMAEKMQESGISYANQTTVSRIENQIRPVRLGEADAIAEIFDTTLTAILDPAGPESVLSFLRINHAAATEQIENIRSAAYKAGQRQELIRNDATWFPSKYSSQFEAAGDKFRLAYDQFLVDAERISGVDIAAVAAEAAADGRAEVQGR